MKKKILSLCLVICLAATAIVGGTLAYFTDAEQETNVMTIGNVEINIEELAKDPTTGAFEKFDQNDFTLYPIDDTQGGAQFNKMVYTFNTSKSEDDAYIRTIVAVEDFDWEEAGLEADFKGVHWAYSGVDYTMSGKTVHGAAYETYANMTIDGKQYDVYVFTAKDEKAIPYGEALEAINSVWLDKSITQEQAAGWDGSIDIIVFSQGIQSTGLTHAQAMTELGAITNENLSTWIGEDNATINDIFE